MYDRTYGAKHHLLGDRYVGAADIAKLIRADIKAGVKSGDLPTTFNGHEVTYAVTVNNFSGGRSINVAIRGVPEDARRRNLEPGDWGYHDHLSETKRDTEAAVELKAKVNSYLNAYNHDGSDTMTDHFDVNYYGNADFESMWTAEDRKRKAEKAAAQKANPKPKSDRPSKRDLINHLRYGHRRAYGPKYSIDVMLAAHMFLHREGAADAGHTHDDGDLLLPRVGAEV